MIGNKLKIDWVSVVLTEFPPFYKSNLIFDFEFLFFSRWNLTTMFWQKIQIFYEHTYIYQIYIKIHAMSVCLSFILTPFPWTNLRAKYIYGILLTWWIYSDYLKVIRIEIKNKCLFLKKKLKKKFLKKNFQFFFFFFFSNFHPSHSRRANEAPRRGVIREYT